MEKTGTSVPTDPPLYMQWGSTGSAADLILGFLGQWAKKNGHASTAAFLHEEAGRILMKLYQEFKGIEADGNCGPETRRAMLEDGFDFTAEAKKRQGLTAFIQPDESVLYWGPHIPAHRPTGTGN